MAAEDKHPDSVRIDNLVSVVGEMKGQVESVVAATTDLRSSVEGLRDAVAGMVRLEMSHSMTASKLAEQTVHNTKVDGRLQKLEEDMPALRELRQDVRRGVWIIISAVIVALMALVLQK